MAETRHFYEVFLSVAMQFGSTRPAYYSLITMALNCGAGLDFKPPGQSRSTDSRLVTMRAITAELEAYFLPPT